MQRKKIGPGVYAVGPLGEIEMEQWVINDRKMHGLPTPPRALHLTSKPQYSPPAVVYEDKIEVRAGSPLAIVHQQWTPVPDPLKPWGDVP